MSRIDNEAWVQMFKAVEKPAQKIPVNNLELPNKADRVSTLWQKMLAEAARPNLPEDKDSFRQLLLEGDTKAVKLLIAYFRAKCMTPTSLELISEAYQYDDYVRVMTGHGVYEEDIEAYNSNYPDMIKTDFENLPEGNGWKLHLNVAPIHVQIVNRHLIEHGFYFKYLSGGEVSDGKIFTIYIGSWKKAKPLAEELAASLAGKLLRPICGDEYEFASGVVGRFRAPRKNYRQYGTIGFSQAIEPKDRYTIAKYKHDNDPSSVTADELATLAELVEEESMKQLLTEFGDIFYDPRVQ